MEETRPKERSMRLALSGAEQYLAEQGVADAAVDAWILLEFATGVSRADYLADREQNMSTEQRDAYAALIKKRGSHIPLQHLTGEQDFMGLSFQVSSKVLIPRQDTETLVEEVLGCIAESMERKKAFYQKEPYRILDLCTGSGCIAISIAAFMAKQKNQAAKPEILASDLSEEALTLAKKNADRLLKGELREQITFLRSDLFDEIAPVSFDLIVSNPPYIRSGELADLEEEVRLHEPCTALDGGEDGLDFYRRIARESPDYLRPMGRLFLEIGYDEADAVMELLSRNGFGQLEVKKDLSGRERVVCAVLQGGKNV